MNKILGFERYSFDVDSYPVYRPRYLHAMTLAENIFAEVRGLSEPQAREVLDFVCFLKSKQHADRHLERHAALAELVRYRGRFKAEKFSRVDLYDRALD